jgi:adenylate kinase
MRLILLGAPGAGKGTHAAAICQQYGIPQISTGDMLHAAMRSGSEYGKRAKKFVDAGQLVPDSLIIGLVKARIAMADCGNGFLFDGFPRTIPQTEAMEENGVNVDFVLELDVPDEELIQRLAGRRVHPGSGRTYHVRFNPPKVADKDDVTGEDLIRRGDDEEAAVRTRIGIYREQTTQLGEYYSAWADSGDTRAPKYFKVNASGSVEAVRERILAAVAMAEQA